MRRGACVIAGPAGCGKTSHLLGEYRRVLEQEPPGSALWLSPTHRAATAVRHQILNDDLPGCLSPNCLTFDQFARRIVAASNLRTRALSRSQVRQIQQGLVSEALAKGELTYFAPIARTSGFLELVAQFIQELKRLEIWPEELSAASGRTNPKDRELSLIYARYQQLLTAHDLYDAAGHFWSARALLQEGQQAPFENLRHLFVDGFTDFTRTEHEMLQILAPRVESLHISLPLDPASEREDLFFKAQKTREQLQRRHPGLELIEMPRRATAWPAMDHLERWLFANPRLVMPAASTAGLEIVAAGGVTHEIELLARRVKRLLVEGDREHDCAVRPSEILVVFRSLADLGEVVGDVFSRFGIPTTIAGDAPLARAPVLSALVGWLQLELEDWPFRRVLAMLLHNYFRPCWPEWRAGQAVASAELLVRSLGMTGGRQSLLAACQRAAARAQRAVDEQTAEMADYRVLHGAALLERLAATLDRLPRQAKLGEWIVAIQDFALETGLMPRETNSDDVDEDQVAFQQLISALRESVRLTQDMKQPASVLDRRSFLDLVQGILRCESLPAERDETGTVRVISADQARNVSAPYVFLAGLSEKAFPPPGREDCIFSDAETRQLIEAGLPLVPHEERGRFEMLLFYEVVTRATRRLVLSYPALDSAAQPLVPSPYLSEVEQACGPGRIARAGDPDLSCVPAGEDVLSPRDLRVHAVAQALAGDYSTLARLPRQKELGRAAENLLASLAVCDSRSRGETFGAFEGMLFSSAAEEELRKLYGPQRCWSPSQLEQYAACPYQFFLSRVLRLEPLEEPGLEVDYLNRGRMLHWLLSSLHRQLNEQQGAPCSPTAQQDEQLAQLMERLLLEAVGRLERDNPLHNGLLELDARLVRSATKRYRRQHSGYDEQWAGLSEPLRPTYFEVGFGPSRRPARSASQPEELEDTDPLSSEEPFELDCGDEVIRFAGRIDRIDIGSVAERVVFSVVDYKSGRHSARTSAQSVVDGYSLQLPLYALAAGQLLSKQDALPFRAAYWHVAGDGYKEKDAIHFHLDAEGQLVVSPMWEQLQTQLRLRVRSLVEGIRRGQFPMQSVDDQCTSRCDFRTVCRVHQARALGKAWQPPREVPA